jgi:Protein of unknown function (DUF4019)
MNEGYRIVLRRCGLTVISGMLLLLSSCSSSKGKQLAEQGVSQFHEQLNSEQYHVMYAGSDERLHQASGEEQFVALVQAVHRKLGDVQASNLKSFQVGWFAGQGETVTLFYETRFAEGNAGEKFTWHISNDRPMLVGYFINSNALITK